MKPMMKPIEIDNRDAIVSEERKVPLADIIAQHRRRWKLETTIGTIILRRIPYMAMEETTIRLMERYPWYADALRQTQEMLTRAQFDDGLSPDELKLLDELGRKLSVPIKEYTLRCFVEPELETIEELDAVLTALNEEERAVLMGLLEDLQRANPDGEVHSEIISTAAEYGIPITDDLTMENMTAQQMAAITQASERRGKAMTEVLKGVTSGG